MVLLIDRNEIFAVVFERFSKRYDVPVRSFDSMLSLKDDRRWNTISCSSIKARSEKA